jgi:hypothetical protein
MFSSGVVKLTSGDMTWRDLTALLFHYETQPLPTWIGWYAHQLPSLLQKFSVVAMFFVELFIPFLVFGTAISRRIACLILIGFQFLIAATGNYGFFNLLTIALSILLLDDAIWPDRLKKWFAPRKEEIETKSWTRWIIAPFAAIILIVTSIQMTSIFRTRIPWPIPIAVLYRAAAPFNSINSYGLFAMMTTSRPEIIIEGSNDGLDWRTYEFKWKAGDLKKRPKFVAPHQPRLDWQMWFAALGSYRQNPWFINFLVRLLQGSPDVLSLLERNPFPQSPPKFIRAGLYEYRFTTLAEGGVHKAWWKRELGGSYSPVMSQDMISK